MIAEDLDTRVWCALRGVDAITQRPLALRVEGEGQHWQPNASGLAVLRRLRLAGRPELQDYEQQFAAPPALAPVAAETLLTPLDPTWLPRRARLPLPREGEALFEAIVLRCWPAPAAATAMPWTLLRISLAGFGPAVLEAGGQLAQADARGEALLVLPGLPQGVERELVLSLVHEPGGSWPPDPEHLLARNDAGVQRRQQAVRVAGGRTATLSLSA